MKLIVIGHGMVGHKFLETLFADASAADAFDITVLCEEPRPAYDRVHLSSFFSGTTAEQLSLVAPGFFERHADRIALKLNARAAAVDRTAKTVLLASGEVLAYDKLVFATGSTPFVPPVPGRERQECFVYRTIEDLEARLACGSRARSGAEVGGGLLGLECAKARRDMARTVARALLGQPGTFGGADMITKLKLMGVDVASIGDAHGAAPGSRSFQFTDERKQVYKKIVVSDCGKRLLGAVLVGDAAEYGTLQQMMLNAMALPASPEFLILPALDGAARPSIGVDALPAAAQVCSCNAVSKGDICSAVAAGACDIGAVKSCTSAGTSCGGCVPLVTQIMKAEMQKAGLAVSNHLCEHFPYSRQELHHLIRVGGIKSFGELLDKHGKGLGCDICKPVAANILASTWNDFVLKPEHASLQDSNDYFLGNIQKDGTYSVVPRLPGGEVTPDGLIAVGQVAKKYGLYTKITGGARVDMFGARVEQLPAIWEELIAAGFESGHAYGKSLRTVKSCVGSTWCRYGVDDSVGLAVELENRYKGLRAPHKIKFGVSGCTRECAEAQGKDGGLIATDKGWNLYVCGNGGMKPRHAELLASNLDEATVVKLVDRFLMFYVRTADRLQRTSTWRENLEGGLDYLKDVVVNDKLGIAAELEAEMQHVVDTYACEWKSAVENPEIRARFRTFVNSETVDANVVFMPERGQIRPATFEERRRVIPIAVGSN